MNSAIADALRPLLGEAKVDVDPDRRSGARRHDYWMLSAVRATIVGAPGPTAACVVRSRRGGRCPGDPAVGQRDGNSR